MIKEKIKKHALKYIGVGFQHQGRVPVSIRESEEFQNFKNFKDGDYVNLKKSFKLDCAGLVVEVMKDCEIFKEGDDLKVYERRPDGVSLVKHLNKTLTLKNKDEREVGDLFVMSFNNEPSHLALYLGKDENGVEFIIHSYLLNKRVVLHCLNSEWLGFVVGVYSFKEGD